MKFTTAATASILAFGASAAPLEPRQTTYQTFTMMALRSGSTIHLSPIHANGGNLWIGKDTAAYCPDTASCSGVTSNTTAISSSTADDASASMDVVVPGGQQAYISNTDGAFHWTAPHSAYVPEGSYRTGFKYTPPASSDAAFGYFSYSDKAWYACPTDSAYKIVADVTGTQSSDCIPFEMAAISYSGSPAWEYT